MKIDVEGFEDRVLEGMRRVLTESHPAIIVECHPDGPYRTVQKILAHYGYRFFALREPEPIAMVEIVPDVAGRYYNYLCMPEKRFEELASFLT